MKVFKLTKYQIKRIGKEIEKVRVAAVENKPGMLLGQIGTTGIIRIGFIDNKMARKVQEAIGAEVGKSGNL